MKKIALGLGILLLSFFTAFGINDNRNVLLTGETIVNGKYSVYASDDTYYFNGNEYEVYDIEYEKELENMKIAVNGKSYIAYTSDFTIFYKCDRNGFGVRKVLFSSPEAINNFNNREFSKQLILSDKKKIDTISAVGLIAFYLPNLKQ